jgi:hypothetical protein
MLGGGVFVTQNKTLPGSYINFVNASTAGSAVGERGAVAIALPLGKSNGKVIELTALDFVKNCSTLLGKEYTSNDVIALREIFRHATKVYVYDLGTDGKVADAINALEPYDFNVLCAYTGESADVTAYITAVKKWRDELGKKCQVVVYNQTGVDHEGVINVVSTVDDDGAAAYALTAWLAGAEAGCAINESCTNMLYDGEYTVVTDKTQAELETCLENGQVAFHLVYGDVRVLEDINSLTTTTNDKGEDFKYNQTIRVVDQIANDIANLFNTQYLGVVPNNASGRASLWGEIVAHHRELEAMQAIENFDSSLLTIEQGATKKSVVVNDVITVVNAMAQLYMTVVIQ